MATQDHIAVSNPSFAAESVAIHQVMDKDRKKQKKEMAHLASLLKLVEEEIKTAKEGATETPEESKVVAFEGEGNPVGNSSFDEAMAKMALALQLLQVHIVKFDQEKATYDSNISQDQVRLAQKNLNELEKKLEKIQKQERKEKRASFWEKFADVAIAVVSAVVAVATAQPELLAITIMSLASATGVINDATKGLAALIQDAIPSISPELANIIASVVVCVLIIAISFSIDPEEIVQESADTGENISMSIEEAANSVSSSTEGAAETTEETSTSLLEKAKKLNIFRKLNIKTNIRIFYAANAIASTQVVSKVVAGCMSLCHSSEKKKEEMKEYLTIIIAVIAMMVSMGSGAAAMEGAGLKSGMKLGESSPKLLKLLSASKSIYNAGATLQLGAGISKGAFEIQQGMFEKDAAEINANLKLVQTAMEMNSTETQEDQKHDANVIKQQKVGDRSLSELMRGEAGFAELFTQYIPV